jgi:hypothetical protein
MMQIERDYATSTGTAFVSPAFDCLLAAETVGGTVPMNFVHGSEI